MLWEEMIQDEREDAKAEGLEIGRTEGLEAGRTEGLAAGRIESHIENILEVLSLFGDELPGDLIQKIRETTDVEILKSYFTKALKSKTIEEFEDFIRS